MDRNSDSSTVTATEGAARSAPQPFEFIPFHLERCTLDRRPTAAEQAGYDALRRQCRRLEEFWDRASAADWMLDVLIKVRDRLPAESEGALRRFALRCVERLEASANPGVQELLEAVRRHMSGAATLDDLDALRARTHPHVAQGGVQGVPRCSTYAAAMLAAWHTADHDPLVAAFWSAEFAARHDAFVVLAQQAATWRWPEDRGEPWRESWRTAFFAKAHPDVEAAALADARQRQADLLRSILPAPFGVPVRAEVYFPKVQDTSRLSVYCTTCGFQRNDATPGMLFDVRGMLCKSCRAPIALRVH